MNQTYRAEEIFNMLLTPTNDQVGLLLGVAAYNDFFVINGQHGPRWIVPCRPQLGLPVLKQWHPYNFTSRINWGCFLFLYSKRLLGRIPSIRKVNITAPGKLRMPGCTADLVPVIYVGTPGPQQKAVVTLVDPESCTPQAIMKVALSEGARASLLKETKILEKLAAANVAGTPSLLGVEECGGRTWQTVIAGRLLSRKLTNAHINWLLQLPRSEKTTTLSDQQELLSSHIREDNLSDKCRKAVSDSVAMIEGRRQMPLVMVHGDFTPWNLKRQNEGRIGAIDWEDAEQEGLPLWDLSHFYFMQAHLFNDRNPMKRLTTSPLVQHYFQKMGIEAREIVPLVLLYLLCTIYKRKGVISEAYKRFLLHQIDLMVMA